MHYFSLTLLWYCTILLAALLLLDNYLEGVFMAKL